MNLRWGSWSFCAIKTPVLLCTVLRILHFCVELQFRIALVNQIRHIKKRPENSGRFFVTIRKYFRDASSLNAGTI
jgi:hypothetical protein